MKFVKLRLAVMGAACFAPCLIPGFAMAQANSSTQTVEGVIVTASPVDIKKPTTAGSRLDIPVIETPASVQILSGDVIRQLGETSILQAETEAPGVTTAASPGNGNLGLSYRGFTGVNAVMQLYDGVQLAVGSGTVSFPFSTWNVDHIEVLGGPDSVLYGVGAIGGTINVVPRRPNTEQASTDVQFAGGSFDTFQEAVDTTGPLNAQTAFRLDVDHESSDGWLDRNDASNSTAVSGTIQYQAAPNLRLSVSDDFGYNQPAEYWGTPLIAGKLDTALRDVNFNVSDSDMKFADNIAQFKADWDASSSLAVHNDLYLLNTQREWHDLESYAYQPSSGDVLRSGYFFIRHFETQVGDEAYATYASKLFGLENEIEGGIEFNAIRFENASNSPYGGSSLVDPFSFSPGTFQSPSVFAPRVITHSDEYSIFGEDRLKLLDNLSVVVGGRYDVTDLRYTDATIGTAVYDKGSDFDKTLEGPSYRVGVVYNPVQNLALYAQYSAATGSVGSLITTTLAQSAFKLATGRQIEAGVKQSFLDGHGQWTFAAYRIVENNLLTPDPTNPTISEQVGQQSSRGLEASVQLALIAGWSIDANGTILKARYDDFSQSVSGVAVSRAGDRPPNVPEQAANGWIRWRFAGDWELRAGVQYVGDRYADAANTLLLPSYEIVSTGLRWTPLPKLSVDLRADNALDQTYVTVAGNNGTQWYLGEPRSVMLTLNYKLQ